MKKLLTLFALALAATGVANAQRAAEYSVSQRQYKTSSPAITGYNRIGLSYNNTQVTMGADLKDEMDNFKLNGFGIDYIHGFALSSTMPMFIETGANVNFNFGKQAEIKAGSNYYRYAVQDFNLQVPVNYVYRFGISDEFSIAPYVGLNFKLHLVSQGREEVKYEGQKESGDWDNFFSKDDMGEDGTFNRFQMGWHIGLNFQYSQISLIVQYGTDFIPFYSYSEYGFKERINTGNLKIGLGYNF